MGQTTSTPTTATPTTDHGLTSSPSPENATTDYLRSASFSRGDGPVLNPDSALTASDLFQAAADPTRLHPLAELGDKLDYLLLDDDKTSEMPGADTALPSRGWSDDLCYGTGTMYLSGEFLDLFHISTFVSPLLLSVHLTLLMLSRHPSLVSLIVLFCHMLTLFFKV